MTTEYRPPRMQSEAAALLREALALVLLIAGVVGLAVAAFAVDWRLGLASLSVGAIGTGVFLGYTR